MALCSPLSTVDDYVVYACSFHDTLIKNFITLSKVGQKMENICIRHLRARAVQEIRHHITAWDDNNSKATELETMACVYLMCR